ncbi:MAG: hypothetical protein QM706_05060 [Nitrospira sp.]
MDMDLILNCEVVTLFPDGLVGMLRKLSANKPAPPSLMKTEGTPVA